MFVEIAPAKVNLFLHITGRDQKGYHLLQSLFAFTQKGDVLTFSESDHTNHPGSLQKSIPFTLSVQSHDKNTVNDHGFDEKQNTVYRAATALLQYVNETRCSDKTLPTVDIKLEKSLPIAAGLGGGSADAAATLRGLIKFWDLDIPDPHLIELALGIGADVPACLNPKPQWVEGIGEQCKEIESKFSPYIVLVNPGLPTSTQKVFDAYKNQAHSFDAVLSQKIDPVTISYFQDETHNCLTGPAQTVNPKITKVLSALEATSGVQLVRMSGSGATCFAIYDTVVDAELAKFQLKQHHPDWWVISDLLQLN